LEEAGRHSFAIHGCFANDDAKYKEQSADLTQMASFFLTSLVAAGLMVAPAKTETTQIDKADPPVIQVAGVCDRAVEQALAMTGGELLSEIGRAHV
jgi:hypothetical protein